MAPSECAACRRWALAWSHRSELLAVARRRVPCKDDADDVVNEAMLRAVLYADLDEARIAPWMTRVVMNLCADLGRDRARVGKRWRYAQMMDMDVPTPEEVAVERAAASSGCARLSALPSTQRTALLLRAEGLPVGQVASELGVPYKAAESLLSRGRAAVRAALVAGVAGVLGGMRRSAVPVSGMAAAALAVAVWMPPSQPPAPPAIGAAAAPQFSGTTATAAAPDRRADTSATGRQVAGQTSAASAQAPSPPRPAAPVKRQVVAPVAAGAPGLGVSGGGVTAQDHERPWQDELAECLLDGQLITPERVGCPPPQDDSSANTAAAPTP